LSLLETEVLATVLHLSWMLAYGASWGILMYFQPSLVVILPFHLLIVLLTHRTVPLISKLQFASAVGLMFVGVLLPWVIRCRLVLGEWMFMRDNLGLELHLADSNLSRASTQDNMGSRQYFENHPCYSLAEAQKVLQLGEIEYEHRLLKEATLWIKENRASFIRLTLERMLYFWTDLPSSYTTLFLRSLLSIGTLLGLGRMWRDGFKLQALLFAPILCIYPASCYLFQYSNRYVARIAFALLLPAGFALSRMKGFHLGRTVAKSA